MEPTKTLPAKLLLAACAFLLLSRAVFALELQDEQHIQDILSTCMDQVRQHHTGRECDQFERMRKEHGVSMATYLEDYVADPCSRVRLHAYGSLILLGLDVNDEQGRRKIVDTLIGRIEKEEEGELNWQYLLQRLARFTSADFSEPSRQLVRDLLLRALTDMHMSRRGDIILLAGVADLRSELPRLKLFIDEHEGKLKQQHEQSLAEWRKTVERIPERTRAYYANTLLKQYWQSSLLWAALRARARMGVKDDIARSIELVESHPDEDYRVVALLKELSYVRRPEVVDYLRTYLKSDKLEAYKGPCVVRTSYGQLAALALGQMLRGFPWKKNYAPNEEMIKRCREWMAEQKNWDIIR